MGPPGSQALMHVRCQDIVVNLVDGQMADGRHDALEVVGLVDDGRLVRVLQQVVRCGLTEQPLWPSSVHLDGTKLFETPDQPLLRFLKIREATPEKSSAGVPLVDLPGSFSSGIDSRHLSAHA